ncbi:MAG: alpha/beta hydrolase domain-containing protein, partial [Candidatus Binatia bacterium]
MIGLAAWLAGSGRGGVAAAAPMLTGPITGPGRPVVASTSFDLAPLAYVEEEFFLAGTASAYTSVAPLDLDGHWTASPANT